MTSADQAAHRLRDLVGQIWRHGVADLMILLRARAAEKVIVREGLQPGSLADSQRATLSRIRVNEIVAVFRDVTGYGCRRSSCHLGSEAIGEIA